MDVVFRDPPTQRLFNEHARVEARYGAELALKAAVRLAILAAARNLAVLPSAPPIGFEALGEGAGYAVALDATHRLRFRGVDARTGSGGGLAAVRAVEVIGIEALAVDDRRRRR